MKKEKILIGISIGLVFLGGIICLYIVALKKAHIEAVSPFQAVEQLAVSVPFETIDESDFINGVQRIPTIGAEGSILLQDGELFKISEIQEELPYFSIQIPYSSICSISISAEVDLVAGLYFESSDEQELIDQTKILQNETSSITRFLQEGLYFIHIFDVDPESLGEFSIQYEVESDEDLVGNSYEQATVLAVPDEINSGIEYAADEDWYTFEVDFEREMNISLKGESDFMAVLYQFDENEGLVYISDNQNSIDRLTQDEMVLPTDESFKENEEEKKQETKDSLPESKNVETTPSVPEESIPASSSDQKQDQKERPVEQTPPSTYGSISKETGLNVQQISRSVETSTAQETSSSIVGNESIEFVPEENVDEKKVRLEKNNDIAEQLIPGQYFLRIYNMNLVADTYSIILHSDILADVGDTWEAFFELRIDEEYSEKFESYVDEDWYMFNVEDDPVQIVISDCEANMLVYKHIYEEELMYYDNQSYSTSENIKTFTFSDSGQYYIRLYGGDPQLMPYRIGMKSEAVEMKR